MRGESHRICIVGGGLAGIATAYYLVVKKGLRDVVVLEKEDRASGLLRSEVVNGFTFDVGGSHIIFSKDQELLKEILKILGSNYLRHRRVSKILIGDRLVKYPFENGLKDLPPETRYLCLRDLINTYIKRIKGELRPPKNFLEWLYYVFGNSIVNIYLRPYNEKLWKLDLRELTLEWVGGRVPNPPLDDVIKSAVGLETEGYVHQLNFYYPLKGGIEALIESLLNPVVKAGANVLTNSEVVRIERERNGKGLIISTKNGLEFKCEYVIYTAPLNLLSKIGRNLLSKEDIDLISRLRSVPLAIVSLGIRGEAPPYHWIYIPQEDIVFHRIAFISNYSPYNSPKGTYSLIAEVSFREVDELRGYDSYKLVREVIEGLEYIGFLKSASQVITSLVTKWDHAYVVYDRVRSEVFKKVLSRLTSKGIFPHGRFGSWEYVNMDAVISKSARLANEIVPT